VIEVDDRAVSGAPVDEIAEVVATVLAAEGARGAEVGILLVGDAEMQSLNLAHRGIDAPTDVLAFPIDEGGPLLDGVPQMLGDVVVCVSVALAQAVEAGVAPGVELLELLVHGTLHLLGYDHERDDGEMSARQAVLVDLLPPITWDGPATT
jgi:probable rRNA maturation factor